MTVRGHSVHERLDVAVLYMVRADHEMKAARESGDKNRLAKSRQERLDQHDRVQRLLKELMGGEP